MFHSFIKLIVSNLHKESGLGTIYYKCNNKFNEQYLLIFILSNYKYYIAVYVSFRKCTLTF